MSFKTTLYKALEAADAIFLGGFEIDDDMIVFHSPAYVDPKDPRAVGYYEIDLSSYDQGEYTIFDQDVEVDDDGFVGVTDSEGGEHIFELRVSRPLTEADL